MHSPFPKPTKPTHLTKHQLIAKLQSRADYCATVCDDPAWEGLKTEHEGETLDYWQGALTSACLALHAAKKLKETSKP